VSHGIQSATYHQLHIDQLLKLYTMTGAVELARDADLLYVDYPRPSLIATLTFVAGTHTGYRFNWSTGAIIGSKTATLSRSSSAPVATRERIKGRAGYWFRITAGIWAGYWIPETPGRSYVAGQLALVQAYDPPRTVTFAAGTYVGYVFNAGGAVTKSKVASLSRTSTASADQRVVINGRGYLRITNGIWAGMFVPLGTGISY
jgi:hypothetical protein